LPARHAAAGWAVALGEAKSVLYSEYLWHRPDINFQQGALQVYSFDTARGSVCAQRTIFFVFLEPYNIMKLSG
jgi:hypothetical protein